MQPVGKVFDVMVVRLPANSVIERRSKGRFLGFPLSMANEFPHQWDSGSRISVNHGWIGAIYSKPLLFEISAAPLHNPYL